MDTQYVIGRPESAAISYPHPSAIDDIDNNDTIDCLTLPDCDVPDDHSIGFSQLPGTVFQSKMGRLRAPSAQFECEINTGNLLSHTVAKPALDDRDPFNFHPENSVTTAMATNTSKHSFILNTSLANRFPPGMNLNAKTSSKHSESDFAFLPSKDYTEFSNASKSTKSGKTRPNSTGRYNRYAFDPPKPPRLCPRTKQAPKSPSDTSQTEQSDVPKSTVYVTSSQGTLYRLQFQAKNINLSPLYANPRYVVQLENEKQVQPDHYAYPDQVRQSDIAAHLVRQKYALSNEEQPPKQSKALLPPLRVYTDEMPTLNKRSKSEPGRDRAASATMGSIHFEYKGISIKVWVPAFPITNMKLPVREEIMARMIELGMPTTDSRKNKGTVIGRCGQDLLQFKFDMDDLSMNKVELKGTAAVQTEDKMVYIRERSHITGRMLLLALPESTYFYQDPMKTIHRVHMNFQRTNVVPLWKYELMKSRLAEKQGLNQTEEKLNKIFQQTRGTRLFFEGLDSLITAQTGLLCCEVTSGKRKYEELIMSYQGQKKQPKRPPQFLYVRSATGEKQGPANSSKVSAVDTGESASVAPETEPEPS